MLILSLMKMFMMVIMSIDVNRMYEDETEDESADDGDAISLDSASEC